MTFNARRGQPAVLGGPVVDRAAEQNSHSGCLHGARGAALIAGRDVQWAKLVDCAPAAPLPRPMDKALTGART